MNDQRLNELVRMAIEVEDLDSDAGEHRGLRLVGGVGQIPPRTVHRAWWIAAGAAVAAGIVVAIGLPVYLRPAPAASGPSIAERTNPSQSPALSDSGLEQASDVRMGTLVLCGPKQAVPYPPRFQYDRPELGEVQRCAIVAIYRDQRGGAQCAAVHPYTWSENKCLSEVTSQELRSAAVGPPCVPARPNLVVALAGPQRALPKTEADALNLATCILGSPHDCGGDGRCLSHVAMQCVDPYVSVKVETLADSR